MKEDGIRLKDIFEDTEEEKMLRIETRRWAQDKLTPIRDETLLMNEFSLEHFYQAFEEAKGQGFTAVGISDEYGGMPMSSRCITIVMEEVSRIAGDYALMFATNSLVAPPIENFGTEEQKQKWLPVIATGDVIGGFCQTEANAGSDVTGIKLKAEERDKKWHLSGTKMFVTLGYVADVLIVIARTSPEKHKGLTAFIVDAKLARKTKNSDGNPQLISDKNEHKLGIHQIPTTMMVFQDCEAELLGEIGAGWLIAMTTLVGSRGVGIPPKSVGVAKDAYKIAYDYAHEREVFGEKISNFDAIQQKLINMEAMIKMSELLMWHAAEAKDNAPATDSRPYTLEASFAKLVCAVFVEKVVTSAIQVLGGYGYMTEYILPKHYQDARIDRLFEGTDEIQERISMGEIFKRGGKDLGILSFLSLSRALSPFYKKYRETAIQNWPFSKIEDDNLASLGEFEEIILDLRRMCIDIFVDAMPRPEDLSTLAKAIKNKKQFRKIIKNNFEKIGNSVSLDNTLHEWVRAMSYLQAGTLTAQNYVYNKNCGNELTERDRIVVVESLRISKTAFNKVIDLLEYKSII